MAGGRLQTKRASVPFPVTAKNVSQKQLHVQNSMIDIVFTQTTQKYLVFLEAAIALDTCNLTFKTCVILFETISFLIYYLSVASLYRIIYHVPIVPPAIYD